MLKNIKKNKLSKEQYSVAIEGSTEIPFSGSLNYEKRSGVYLCICCDNKLFQSKEKFESGSGWPSFYATFSKEAVSEHVDESHGMIRNEVKCAQCEAHLGHVFPDGPNGLPRYCINATVLEFKTRKEINKS